MSKEYNIRTELARLINQRDSLRFTVAASDERRVRINKLENAIQALYRQLEVVL